VGKYDRVLKELPRLPVERTDYQARVDLAKDAVREALGRPATTSELADTFVKLRREKDDLNEQMSALNLKIEAIEQLTVAAFEAEDVQSLKMADGASVSVQIAPYAGVKDKETFRLWCLEQGFAHEMHLHPSTTQGLVKERLLSGEANPPGVEVFAKSTLVVRGR